MIKQLWGRVTRGLARRERQAVPIVKRDAYGLRSIPHIKCPICKHTLNATKLASGPGDRGPKTGDLGVCHLCGGILEIQDDHGTLAAISDQRWDSMPRAYKDRLIAISQLSLSMAARMNRTSEEEPEWL